MVVGHRVTHYWNDNCGGMLPQAAHDVKNMMLEFLDFEHLNLWCIDW